MAPGDMSARRRYRANTRTAASCVVSGAVAPKTAQRGELEGVLTGSAFFIVAEAFVGLRDLGDEQWFMS